MRVGGCRLSGGWSALLAYLLLHANEPVSADRLVDELWGADVPRTARASLQNNVARLRKALGAERIRLEPAGYVLSVEAERFDLARFGRLVGEAENAPLRERAELLRAALALWRGDPLEDLAFEEFAQLEIARLEDLRLAAWEDWVDAELALGRRVNLVSELRSMVEKHPFDERLRGQLMLCLYRAGRQSDALAAYQDARRVLVNDLGIEPGPQLRELERAILRQDPELAAPATALPGLQPSRRTVTVVFVDLIGSTTLDAQVDPESLSGALARYLAAVRAVVERHGGVVEKSLGDSVMAVFGVPKTREDDTLRAVRSAFAIREALAGLGDSLETRIGVNTGEVFSGSGELTLTGAAINLAKRLEEAALPGEILVGAGALRLVRHAVKAEPAQPLGKGKEKRVLCFRLLEVDEGAPALARRLDAPLVDRDWELAALRTAYKGTCERRHCRRVTVLGEPGIGKTRLAFELLSTLHERATVLAGSCLSYGDGATYLPLAEMIRQAGEDFAARTAEATSTGEIAVSVRRLFEELARDRPLVLLFEDVHWAEPTLLDVVEYLDEHASGPILILSLGRPELLERRPRWISNAISLGELPKQYLRELIDALRPGLTPDLRTRIVEASEGNPLFAEQLVAHLEGEDPDELERVPPSLGMLLASRLDALEPQQRDLLQRAAVFGREFFRGAIVELVSDAAPAVDDRLVSLVRRGLLRPGQSEDLLAFHHVLVRDVAYASIPKSLRAELHEQTAQWLGQHNAGADEVIGYHLEQAHGYRLGLGVADEDIAELAQTAAELLARAGQRALARGDGQGARRLLGRAAGLLSRHDASHGYLLLELGSALLMCDEYLEAEAVFQEALEHGAELADRRLENLAALERASLRARNGADGSAQDLDQIARAAVSFFDEVDDDVGLARAWLSLAQRHGMAMQYRTGAEAAERALAHARKAGDGYREALSHEFRLQQFLRGPMPVSEVLRRCEATLQESRNVSIDAVVLDFVAALHAMAGEFEEAQAAARQSKTIMEDLGLTLLPHRERPQLRAAPSTAEADLRRAYDLAERIGERGWSATLAASLSEVLYLQCRYDEATRFAEISRTIAPADELLAQVLWRGALAKALARRCDFGDAEPLARQAVSLVEPTEALNAHADALIDLAEVLELADRSSEAATLAGLALRLYKQKGNIVSAERAAEFANEVKLVPTEDAPG
jgi:DNA-binding SARP family transcriptional activator